MNAAPWRWSSMELLPKNILVIDDSLTLRKFIEKSLIDEDCVNHLFLASDPRQGLELALTSRPDLIICDYTLPEIKGDELCRQFSKLPYTADIPVILMSSSSLEMCSLDLQRTNIVRLLVKPFSRELLVATVAYVLSHWEQKRGMQETVSTIGTVILRGNSDAFPMSSVLRFIGQEKLTGVLRTNVKGRTLHVFCKEGCIWLVCTRDVEEYLRDTPFLANGTKSPFWKKSEEKQRETLSPFLLNLSMEGILPLQTALTLTDLYGHRLFSQVWTERGVTYEFERLPVLPAFAETCQPSTLPINDWILKNLRNVDFADEIKVMKEDPLGIPTFTPQGYKQLQKMVSREEEWQILSQITGNTTLQEICRGLRISVDTAAHKLFCYQRMGFIDYWPSYVLNNQN